MLTAHFPAPGIKQAKRLCRALQMYKAALPILQAKQAAIHGRKADTNPFVFQLQRHIPKKHLLGIPPLMTSMS